MKWFKKFLLFCFLAFTLLAVIVTVTIAVYGDDIKAYVSDSLKQKLNKDVQISDTKFSGIRHIPNVGLHINNLYSPGFTSNDTLLYSSNVLIAFNLFDLLRGKMNIEKIELKNGIINVIKNKNGENNFTLNKSGDNTKDSKFNFNKIQLTNIEINYLDEVKNTSVSTLFNNMRIKGFYADKLFDIKAVGSSNVNRVYAAKSAWVSQKIKCKTNAHVRYNEAEKSIHFLNSEIEIEDSPVFIDGSIITLNSQNQFQLTIHSDKLNIQEIKKHIPEKYYSKFEDYELKGITIFHCSLSGSDAENEGILTELCFDSNNSEVLLIKKGTHIKLNTIKGCYSFNPNSKDEILDISKFTATVNGDELSGNIKIKDFNDPFISVEAIGDLNLSLINSLVTIDNVDTVSGNLKLDMTFEGDFNKEATYKSEGTIELQNVNFSYKDNPLKLKSMNGKFVLEDNQIEVKDFSANLNESDILVNGQVTNLYNYLILGDENLQANASLSSNILDLNSVWNTSTNKSDTTFVVNFAKGLDITLSLNLNEFYFKKFEAKNVTGTVSLKDQVLATDKLALNAMDGSAMIKGRIDGTTDEVKIFTQSSVSKIDIHKLFYQVGNFGQDVVIYQNLKGLVSANITFNSFWSKTLEADLDKVYAQSDFIIENGELNNFDPMLALSKYVKGTNLKHVAFSTLSNSIEIKDQKIYFPSMEIKSSALDIVASGIHTFDNDIDYNIQLLISEILGKKVKKLNTEFGQIEDDGLGRSKLFLTMTGSVEEPRFALDKKGLVNKIAQDIKNEKKELRQLLHTEFGKDKKPQSSEKISSDKQDTDFEIGEEEDFEIIDD